MTIVKKDTIFITFQINHVFFSSMANVPLNGLCYFIIFKRSDTYKYIALILTTPNMIFITNAKCPEPVFPRTAGMLMWTASECVNCFQIYDMLSGY